MRALPIAAGVELLSLAVLLLNLATVHLPSVTSSTGPVHGCAYLLVVIATARHTRADGLAKVLALVPGIGGLLVVRRLARVGDVGTGTVS